MEGIIEEYIRYKIRTVGVILNTLENSFAAILAAMLVCEKVYLLDPTMGSNIKERLSEDYLIDGIYHEKGLSVSIKNENSLNDIYVKIPIDKMKENNPDICIFTSGTTGKPKTIVLDLIRLSYIYSVGEYSFHEYLPLVSGCPFDITGLGLLGMCFLFPLYTQGHTVLLDPFSYVEPEIYFRKLKEYGVNFQYFVPAIIKNILLSEVDFSNYCSGIVTVSGGALLNHKIQDEYQKYFSKLANVYGVSECGFAVLFGSYDNTTGKYRNDVGKPIGIEVKIDHSLTSLHGKGSLLIKSKSLMKY